MARMVNFISRFLGLQKDYLYLEVTQAALLLHYRTKNDTAQTTRIEFTASEFVNNKLGNLNALKKNLLDFLKNNCIKPYNSCIVSAPYLALCPPTEKPFALMQLMVCLSAAKLTPKKIVIPSIINTTTGNLSNSIKKHTNELTFITQHNNHYPLIKLFLGTVASGIASYGALSLATSKQITITNLKKQSQSLIDLQKNTLQSSASPTHKALPPELNLTFNPTTLLTALAKAIPDNTVITKLSCPQYKPQPAQFKKQHPASITKNERDVIIDGASDSIAAIIDFTNNLTQSGTLSHLTITTISPTQTMPKPFTHVFTLHGTAKLSA